MSSYLIFVLGLLLLEYALDTTSETLNSAKAKNNLTLPSEFQGIYDSEKYKKSLQYLLESTRFGTFHSTVVLVSLILFLLLGGFEKVDQFARGFGFGQVLTGLVFFGALSFLKGTLQLPFSIYDTFVIEQKYGFNQTTAKTFVADLIKGTVLGILVGSPILACILYFFEKAGPLAWLYSWVAVTIFQVLLTFIAPIVILPLFNKFEPLPETDLRKAIQDYAHRQGFQIQGVYTMDSSKRTSKTNAFFTGFGKIRRLVLFDTLIEKHPADELVAVVAHEVGHYQCGHIPRSIVLSIAVSGVLFYVLSLFINHPGIFEAFGVSQLSIYASLVFIGILSAPFMRAFSIVTKYISRRYEYQADDFSIRTFGKPEVLISALKRLSVENLSNLTPHKLKVLLDYTHPPILERIAAIKKGSGLSTTAPKTTLGGQ